MNNFYPIFIDHVEAKHFLVSGIYILILCILICGSQLIKKRPKGISKTYVIFSPNYGSKTKVGFIVLALLISFFVFESQKTSLVVVESGFTKIGIFGIKHVYDWNSFLSAKIKIGAVRGWGKYSHCDARQTYIGFWLYDENSTTVLYEETFYDLLPEDLKSTVMHDFIYDLVYFSKLRHANITVTGPDNDDVADDCKAKGITNPWDIQHSIEGILKEAQSGI